MEMVELRLRAVRKLQVSFSLAWPAQKKNLNPNALSLLPFSLTLTWPLSHSIPCDFTLVLARSSLEEDGVLVMELPPFPVAPARASFPICEFKTVSATQIAI